MRAGVYVFHDLVMLGLGVCAVDELALSVLTTVIGHRPDTGWVLVDAGWMAMSRDLGIPGCAANTGYGLVCDVHGTPIPGLLMASANQEHGILAWPAGDTPADIGAMFPVGTRLRVLPNHACATAAQFPAYAVLGQGGQVQIWPRFYGW